ncbi:UNVERIFIED_CONTAM: Transcription termination factor MTEF18, mitochondrial [Sesamum calycinum]|uniref:Transcription termination factor MTEF18, mitochondrial n=1 Tax=Sesamum calycinum TaxID=2727403 RepID=A0AAW2N4R8_9LAMI
MVKDDPYVLKKWVLGVRVDRLPGPKRVLKVRMLKTKFLLSLGFVEKSKQMEKALKVFRGKGVELQERFDCLVNSGLSREDVIEMLKVSPQILNQSKDVIAKKIEFFVKDMGYPVSALVAHPALVSYKIERVKLRLLTYKWLKDQGAVHPKLALSTLFLMLRGNICQELRLPKAKSSANELSCFSIAPNFEFNEHNLEKANQMESTNVVAYSFRRQCCGCKADKISFSVVQKSLCD